MQSQKVQINRFCSEAYVYNSRIIVHFFWALHATRSECLCEMSYGHNTEVKTTVNPTGCEYNPTFLYVHES